jgi:hypothetical protein
MSKFKQTLLKTLILSLTFTASCTPTSDETALEQNWTSSVDSKNRINNFLSVYKNDPSQAASIHFLKFTEEGALVPKQSLYTEGSSEKSKARYALTRDNWRYSKIICGGSNPCKVPKHKMKFDSNPSSLIGILPDNLESLEEMHKSGLLKSKLSRKHLWSSLSWPLNSGTLAHRYSDQDWPKNKKWSEQHAYYEKNNTLKILKSKNRIAINALSPAEKIDIVLGDSDFTLAKALWKEGAQYNKTFGAVDPWVNLNFGWAASTTMLRTPKKPVVLSSPNGIKVTFSSTDIKGLGALLWAKTQYKRLYTGVRCNKLQPNKSQSGRISDEACPEFDPAVFHRTVVNRIGQQKKFLIMDASLDEDLWNAPIVNYEYSYFNPEDLSIADNLNSAKAALPFKSDNYAKYRNTKSREVVGIAMTIHFLANNSFDSPSNRILKTQYFYDLELDQKGLLVGGEWYNNKHPDFLWAPAPKIRPRTWGDRFVRGAWTGRGTLPWSWRKGGQFDSRSGTPLGHLVYTLFNLSSQESVD